MRRLLTAVIFASGIILTLIIPIAYAQTAESKCTAQMAKSLNIRGLRLGMTTEELLALFPGASDRQDVKSNLASANEYPNFGVVRLSFIRGDESRSLNQERFTGISNVNVVLFDGRIVELSITYLRFEEGGASWDNFDQWITKLNETLKLPESRYWIGNHLMCEGIQIWASPGSLRLFDRAYIMVFRDREIEYRDKRRREFKP
ncbi:MAG: hypothetical protein ACREBD_31635 [Blastocatellia bacterium]